ncbi:MAG: riboflavin synthase [Methyloceanibacter sp.]|uniref:riboflavin synthase n=1 Tax=Methyloceanibacter sp. TaxID=1965321 RepID=UPI003D6D49D9
MFTGIVSGVGTLLERNGSRYSIASPYKRKSLQEGASVACDGCCLTVVAVSKAKGDGAVLAVDVSNETLASTTLGEWQAGRRINLERALALGEELGGHIVTGHVDGRAKVLARHEDGASVRFVLEAPAELAGFIAPKGSVALDGVSLTVNEADSNRFGVNVIPYTLTHTTWGDRAPGDLVNLEVDLLARYVARLAQHEGGRP